MAVKRIKPNILSDRFDESRAFYKGVIGLEGGDGLDWILFFGTDQREVQLSVMNLDIKARAGARGWCRNRLSAYGRRVGVAALLCARSQRSSDQRHGARLILIGGRCPWPGPVFGNVTGATSRGTQTSIGAATARA
jgi:hypothetical protein